MSTHKTAMYTHLGVNTQDCDVHTPRSTHKTAMYTHLGVNTQDCDVNTLGVNTRSVYTHT